MSDFGIGVVGSSQQEVTRGLNSGNVHHAASLRGLIIGTFPGNEIVSLVHHHVVAVELVPHRIVWAVEVHLHTADDQTLDHIITVDANIDVDFGLRADRSQDHDDKSCTTGSTISRCTLSSFQSEMKATASREIHSKHSAANNSSFSTRSKPRANHTTPEKESRRSLIILAKEFIGLEFE